MTAYATSPAGLLYPPARNGTGVAEVARHYAETVEVMESRIAELEARLQEEGWARLGEQTGREFSREALGQILDLARTMYLKNPLVKRAVELGALYVWGQDLSLDVPDAGVKAVVDRFWRENRATLTGEQASRLLEVELQVAGNVFLALFADPASGLVRVRSVPMEEVQAIACNPEDRAEVWYYLRRWREQPLGGGPAEDRQAYHPDWRYRPTTRPASIPQSGGPDIPVAWGAPLLHVKAGAFPHWRWGVPEVYAALDWAKAYKQLLEDDATRSRALARFAWQVMTKGGKAGVAAGKAKLGTTLGTGLGGETNPAPVAGSTFISDDGTDLRALHIGNAALPPGHSRPVRLMTVAALGLPDTFFGDVDQGTLATAESLDRPTELRYSERRQLWRDTFLDLIQWAIDRDLEAPGGLLRVTPSEPAREIGLSWADILERSVTERITAVVDAATLKGLSPSGTLAVETVSRLLLVALGVEDVDGELAKAAEEREKLERERAERAAAMQQQTRPGQPGSGPDDGP